MGGVLVVLDAAVVVEESGERRVGRVQVKGRRVLPVGIVPAQRVAIGRGLEPRIAQVAAVNEVADMVYDHVVDDQNPPSVSRPDHVLQVRQRAPMRVNPVKVPSGIPVELTPPVKAKMRTLPFLGHRCRIDMVLGWLRRLLPFGALRAGRGDLPPSARDRQRLANSQTEYRSRENHTQKELAAKLEAARKTLNNWEKG